MTKDGERLCRLLRACRPCLALGFMLLFAPGFFFLAHLYVTRASSGVDPGVPWALFGGVIFGLFLATVLSMSIERSVIGRVAFSAFLGFARWKLARAGRAPRGMNRVIELGKAWGHLAGLAADLRVWLAYQRDVADVPVLRPAERMFGLFRVETEPIYGDRWRAFRHTKKEPPFARRTEEVLRSLRQSDFAGFVKASADILYHLRYWSADTDDDHLRLSGSITRDGFAEALRELGKKAGDPVAFRLEAQAFVRRFGGGGDFGGSVANRCPRYLPHDSDLFLVYRLITTGRGRSASARAYDANDVFALRTALNWDLLAEEVAERKADSAASLVLAAASRPDALASAYPKGASYAASS